MRQWRGRLRSGNLAGPRETTWNAGQCHQARKLNTDRSWSKLILLLGKIMPNKPDMCLLNCPNFFHPECDCLAVGGCRSKFGRRSFRISSSPSGNGDNQTAFIRSLRLPYTLVQLRPGHCLRCFSNVFKMHPKYQRHRLLSSCQECQLSESKQKRSRWMDSHRIGTFPLNYLHNESYRWR